MPDSQPASGQDVERVAPIIDPGLSPEARDQAASEIRRAGSEAGETSAGCGFMLTIGGVIAVLVLRVAAGLSWWWMLAAAAPLAFGIVMVTALGGRSVAAGDSRVIQAADLDDPCRLLMLRTQRAIRVMLQPRDYAENSLDEVITEATLRRHEWEIAVSLREISKLRAEHGASAGDDPPGPMTAAVLDTQRRALALATDSVTSRIGKLELCAAELEQADAADRDWRAAVKASGRNDQYLDLMARTAADEHAVAEISDLTEHASAAVQVFREHLGQASLAAQALVLPLAVGDDDAR
jgi:hypothetical protein